MTAITLEINLQEFEAHYEYSHTAAKKAAECARDILAAADADLPVKVVVISQGASAACLAELREESDRLEISSSMRLRR